MAYEASVLRRATRRLEGAREERARALEARRREIYTRLPRVAEIDRRIGELNGALAALLETAQTMAEQAGGAQNEAERLRAQEALAMAAAAGGLEIVALGRLDTAEARPAPLYVDNHSRQITAGKIGNSFGF